MKKLVLVIITLVTFSVSAQEKKQKDTTLTAEERVEKRTARLTEKLGLDENQKKKVKEILKAHQKENQTVKEEIKTEIEKTRASNKEKLIKQREALKNKLKPILTEEQLKKWEALQKENKEKAKDRKKQKTE